MTRKMHWTSRRAAIVVPRQRSGLMVDILDDEAILIDPDSGHTHRMNSTALAIWNRCDGVATTRQIALWMAATWAVDSEDALDYVDQLMVRFAEMQIVDAPLCCIGVERSQNHD